MLKKNRAVLGLTLSCGWFGIVLLTPLPGNAQQSDDVMLMDQTQARAAQAKSGLAEVRPPVKLRLSPADQQKYQAWLASMKDKEGDQIILQMQQANAERSNKLAPASQALLEKYKKKLHAEIHTDATRFSEKAAEAAVAKIYLHNQGGSATAAGLSAQQQAYLDYKRAKIKEKYFDAAASAKNQRMLDDANAYLKMHLERQAEYARQLGAGDNPVMKNKAAPLSPDRSKYTWLERQMMTQSAAQLSPNPALLGAQNTAQVQAQIEDYLQQLRSSKSMSVSQRYGVDARILSAAEAQNKLREMPRPAWSMSAPTNVVGAGPVAKNPEKARPAMNTPSGKAIPGL